ncbi:MAG: glutathione S-transferase [Hyphomicrobiaceae bacterium]|nr:glutathione S-transferase [Hyphomicrobiaceae bacterium]
MKLLSSPSSPYVRKVRITARMKGLAGQIEEVAANTQDLNNAELLAANPLFKIPALILDDGSTLYDSAVICEYLDAQVASPVLFPGAGPTRWEALRLGALGDGILDAAILLVYEKRFRPEDMWVTAWMDRQQAKMEGAIAALEANPPAWTGTPNYGHMTIACALGYLDFRHDGFWRKSAPKLAAWLDKFAAEVPAFNETKPAG